MNKIIDHFETLTYLYIQKNDKTKSFAFKRVADTLKVSKPNLKNPTSLKIPGIGKSSINEIIEFQLTGTSQRLKQLQEEIIINADIDEIQQFIPISKLEIISLVQAYPIKDTMDILKLAQNEKLDKVFHQLVMDNLSKTKYFKTVVAKEEIQKLQELLEQISNQVMICGSYRREKKILKDIDVVVTANADKVYDLLHKNYKVLYGGDQKVRIELFNDGNRSLEADVIITNDKEFPTKILYLTGSKDHNVMMRSIAKSKGLRLNEHGIFNSANQKLKIKSEKDIYDILDLEYRHPKDR